MADDNQWMNERLREARNRGRAPIVPEAEAEEQEEASRRPRGDADQGARGTNPRTPPDMNARLRANVRALRNPPPEYYDDDRHNR